MAAAAVAPLPGPLAADQDLEGIDRPAVLAEIPGPPPPVPEAPGRGPAAVPRRVWAAEPAAPSRPVPRL